MKVGEIYGKNRNKKLLVMYIDFFLMTLFGGIYNIYTSKNIGGKIRRFIMMQPKDYSSFGCIIYMFNLRAFYSTPKSL